MKDIKRIIIDFFEERGVYDLLGHDSTKLSYSDVLELEQNMMKSENIDEAEELRQELEETLGKIEELEETLSDTDSQISYVSNRLLALVEQAEKLKKELNPTEIRNILKELMEIRDSIYI